MADRRRRFSAGTYSRNGASSNHDREAEFSRLLEQHEQYVYAYILSLAPNWADADEILQETYIRLFEKADEWDASRNFRAWLCAVARYQVLTYRKRARRDRLRFGQEFIDAIAAYRSEEADGPQVRGELLDKCVEKLAAADRRLIDLVYRDGCSIDQAAQRTRRTSNAAYKTLARIRRMLHDCVERSLRILERRR